jgi:hypothetical protein
MSMFIHPNVYIQSFICVRVNRHGRQSNGQSHSKRLLNNDDEDDDYKSMHGEPIGFRYKTKRNLLANNMSLSSENGANNLPSTTRSHVSFLSDQKPRGELSLK